MSVLTIKTTYAHIVNLKNMLRLATVKAENINGLKILVPDTDKVDGEIDAVISYCQFYGIKFD